MQRSLNEKAFTLVELLAIIIILSIILVITVPKIVGILGESKENASNDTIKSIEKAIVLYASSVDLENEGTLPVTITFENGKYYYQFSDMDNRLEGNILDIKGTAPENGEVIIYADKSYDYQIYESINNECIRNDNTNYLNVKEGIDDPIVINDFESGNNKNINIGTLDLSKFKANDIVVLDYDVEYTDAIYDFDKDNSGIVFSGSRSGGPTISFDRIKVSGTGVYHASNSKKITASQAGKNSFNMNLVIDNYSSGTIKISNIKTIKKDAKTKEKGKCF